ncbi:hypothetical protein NDN08_000839 [Rhodosorus marinus]|uniref:Triosephosphate isomerase n=1 Tax=Rhodosorus marinus TaxID=101924 RepID=A0AAV8URX1_9RHOD|nr:hypothetical protein NDN08_000839 [Rhodosorus marinus]
MSKTNNVSVSRAPTVTMMADRTFFVGGNWKCNGTKDSIVELIDQINEGPSIKDAPVEAVLGVPFPYMSLVSEKLRDDWQVSAQNCWTGDGGAYTGEVSVDMIADCGAEWIILGHSERRHLDVLKETDETIAAKAAYALGKGMKVMYCIGELLSEREADQTLAVCERQMQALKEAVSDYSNVVIAYEPVWAIGTGKVATPEQAQEVHEAVRSWVKENISPEVAESIRILYGGSVSPGNCDELSTKPDVDGFLVGGASLKPDFLKIVDSYKNKN